MLAPIITAPLFYAVAIPAVVFLGLAKGGFSGVATGATPLLALYLPPLEAAALLLPIVICQDVISIHVYRRDWSGWNLKVLLPGAGVGLALGWLFASYVSDDAIRILIGITALLFVMTIWLRAAPARPRQSTLLGGLFWGAVSGFMSFASQGGGPPFQVYTLPQQLPKMTFVGTTTIFFAAVNALKIVPYFMLGQFSAKNSRNFAHAIADCGRGELRRHLDGQDRADSAVLPHQLCPALHSRAVIVLPRCLARAARTALRKGAARRPNRR